MFVEIDATDPVLGMPLGKVKLRVHDPERCRGRPCCVHHPSDHHMVGWPQLWRADRYLMERTCPHGVGHPDPDDLNPDRQHGCDGCCRPPDPAAKE
jgi:hypothetical protein